MGKERVRELNGVLVRAVGSSGSTARRRLRDPPSSSSARDSGAGRACNDVRGKRKTKVEENEKHTRMRAARETVLTRTLDTATRTFSAKSFLTR